MNADELVTRAAWGAHRVPIEMFMGLCGKMGNVLASVGIPETSHGVSMGVSWTSYGSLTITHGSLWTKAPQCNFSRYFRSITSPFACINVCRPHRSREHLA